MSEVLESFIAKNERTFANDDSLPSLPVPALKATLEKYLESVKPHLTSSEFTKTESLVRKFEKNEGEQLQRLLLDEAKHSRNWLAHWWDYYGYFANREPTAPFVNISGVSGGPNQPPALLAAHPLDMASVYVYGLLLFWRCLRKEMIAPQKNSKGAPFAMFQYRHLFSTSRIPQKEADRLDCYFRTESEGATPTHMVVLCGGRVFAFDCVHAITEDLLRPSEIRHQLEVVLETTRQKSAAPNSANGLGLLTALPRDKWAAARQRLIELSSANARSLQLIESSVITLSLDSASPASDSAAFRQSLCGKSVDRWFDKSVVFLSFANGIITTNCEHAAFEGITVVYLGYFAHQWAKEYFEKHYDRELGAQVRRLGPVEELQFSVDAIVVASISEARQVYESNCDLVDVLMNTIDYCGKRWLKEHKLHMDTFVQLSLQLAYYRLHGKPAPTYETATTRTFYRGRTETVRSCTSEALAWCKAMLDADVTNDRRRQLFDAALAKHVQLMTEASNGFGCDRHLFGLYRTVVEHQLPMPEIFTDAAWTKSGGGGNFKLSTSFLGFTTQGGGCAAMCENGYGTFYHIENDSITVAITRWSNDRLTNCSRLLDALHQSVKDLMLLIDNSTPVNKL